MFYGIGYKGLRQPTIFQHASTENEDSAPQPSAPVQLPPNDKKYKRSALKPEEAEQIAGRLHQLMEKENLYLESSIRLKDVAALLEISTNHLSQALNEQLDKNFFEFINGYRVEKAKQLLADPQNAHFTLLAIAYDAGFSTKSTFNKTFKEMTGETPSQYRKQYAR